MLALTDPDDKGLQRLCAKMCAEPRYVITVVRTETGDVDRWADVSILSSNS